MIRNFKAIGLTVIAVLAMSAVVASAAQAAKGKITATSYPATLTGVQASTNNFKIGGGVREVSCTTATFAGTIVESATSRETVTATPTYSGCTAAPGALVAHVTTTGCDYTLENPLSTNKLVTASVTCGENPIKVQITEAGGTVLCEYTVGTQGGLTGSSYANVGSGSTEDILLTLNASPVTKVTKGSKILCGASVAEGTVAATLTGTVTVKADKDEVGGAQIGVMIG